MLNFNKKCWATKPSFSDKMTHIIILIPKTTIYMIDGNSLQHYHHISHLSSSVLFISAEITTKNSIITIRNYSLNLLLPTINRPTKKKYTEMRLSIYFLMKEIKKTSQRTEEKLWNNCSDKPKWKDREKQKQKQEDQRSQNHVFLQIVPFPSDKWITLIK